MRRADENAVSGLVLGAEKRRDMPVVTVLSLLDRLNIAPEQAACKTVYNELYNSKLARMWTSI